VQLLLDVLAGLLPLCREQWLAVSRWEEEEEAKMVLVVGDVVPLLLLAVAAPHTDFVFVGCAKSQHYSDDGLGGELRPWVRPPAPVHHPAFDRWKLWLDFESRITSDSHEVRGSYAPRETNKLNSSSTTP
jgi:hypothetical protein